MKHVLLALTLSLTVCTAPLAAYAAIDTQAPIIATDKLFALTSTDASDAIAQALSEKGAGAKIAVTITSAKSDTLYSYDKPIAAEIRGLRFDENAKSFSANLIILNGEDVISAMPLSGRFEEILEIPVLKRAVKNGEIIGEQDIEIRDVPASRVRMGTVQAMTDLIGKTAVRSVSPNRSIRENELSEPSVVAKGAVVQIRYLASGIEITTSGQAQSSGSRGAIINVKNLASNKIVRAIVESSDVVQVVTASGAQAVALNGAQAYETN